MNNLFVSVRSAINSDFNAEGIVKTYTPPLPNPTPHALPRVVDDRVSK